MISDLAFKISKRTRKLFRRLSFGFLTRVCPICMSHRRRYNMYGSGMEYSIFSNLGIFFDARPPVLYYSRPYWINTTYNNQNKSPENLVPNN